MTTLSTIPQAPDVSERQMITGVEADIPDFTPPAGLERIAFTAKMDGDKLDETLLDALIGSTMAGLDTIIEVPGDMTDADPSFFMMLAANLGASISLLPPDEDNIGADSIEEAREQWYVRNEAFARQLLSMENFSRYLHPVSSFLEFMLAELLHPVDSMIPNDAYVVERFADPVAQPVIDELKKRLRTTIFDAAGGEAEFQTYARAMFQRIYRMADDNAADMLEKIREEARRKTSETSA